MTIDLHLHTHHSDGSWSPSELVEYGVKMKMRCLAVTDHDTTAGIEEATLASQGRLEIIPGVEINTIWNDADGKYRDVHILGYFIDTNNQALKELLEKQREARIT